MSFGLMNTPGSFQTFINDTLAAFLDRYVTTYLDDISIYSNTLDEYRVHGKSVLKVLSQAELHLNQKKCEFHKEKMRYLGLIIRRRVVKIDSEKVAALQVSHVPQSIFDIRSFIEFTNLYRCFIRNLSEIVRPLTALTWKNVKFKWSQEC